jgi:glucose-1-phosphate cytidylyltransferase
VRRPRHPAQGDDRISPEADGDYKSEIIRDYFLNFYARNSDLTIELKTNSVEVHSVDHSCDWKVTLAYTGESTMTGGRIARAVARYLGDAEHYAVTYGDGLTDADIGAELDYHASHGKIGTVLGVNPPSRFGEFRMEGNELVEFVEKPELHSAWINGGYFFFHRSFDGYLSSAEDCVLEREPLAKLAAMASSLCSSTGTFGHAWTPSATMNT